MGACLTADISVIVSGTVVPLAPDPKYWSNVFFPDGGEPFVLVSNGVFNFCSGLSNLFHVVAYANLAPLESFYDRLTAVDFLYSAAVVAFPGNDGLNAGRAILPADGFIPAAIAKEAEFSSVAGVLLV